MLADPANLADLQAEVIAVPGFDQRFLEKGHAIHFRCHREEVAGVRVDLMSRLRGVDSFEALWERRSTMQWQGEEIEALSLPDLVKAKKTQRDKDWPMIRRLLEQDYFRTTDPTPARLA